MDGMLLVFMTKKRLICDNSVADYCLLGHPVIAFGITSSFEIDVLSVAC